jgi:hypothetical protein
MGLRLDLSDMPNRFAGIEFQGIGKLQQFHRVHAPLALLDGGYVGLGAANGVSHGLLRQAEPVALLNEEIAQSQMPRRGEGTWHAALFVKKAA